jgi:hypothetical protein
MFDACEAYFLSTLGGELIGLLLRLATETRQTGDCDHKKLLYHIMK